MKKIWKIIRKSDKNADEYKNLENEKFCIQA